MACGCQLAGSSAKLVGVTREESGYLSIMNSEGVLFIILMAIGKGGYGYLMLLHAICATASYCRAVCRLLLATARYCALLLLLRATARYCEKI